MVGFQMLRLDGHMPRRRFMIAAAVLAGVAATIGAVQVRADVDAAGTLLLVEEPVGAVTLTAAKAKLTPTPQPIVVAGRIGGRGTEPFGKNEATFSMLEIPADDHAA